MYDAKKLKQIYKRLKEQYPRYKVDFLGERLTLTLLHGKVEVDRTGAKLYANGTLCDQFTSEDVEDLDDLYELIEAFLLDFQKLGMESGNETYITAKAKAARQGLRLMLLVASIAAACMFVWILTHNLWWMLPVYVCAAAALIPLAWIRKNTFRRYWVCPQCNKPLPLNKKEHFPEMEYVSQCPNCGCVLEKAPKMEPICPKSDVSIQLQKPAQDLPAPGKKWPCVWAGGITAAIAAVLFPMLFVSDEPLDPAGVTAAIVLLLVLLGFGLALLLCRHTEPEGVRQLVVLRERKIIAVLGMIVWVLGFVMVLLTIFTAGTPPFQAGLTLVLALAGIPIMLLGVWMLLAYHNRALFIFRDNSILYISSFGRRQDFAPGQVASVKMTMQRSVYLLDKNGKKLASVELNMQGASRFAEWIESSGLTATLTSAMEKQVTREAKAKEAVRWREEYRTPLHDHLKAIRIGLVVMLLLLAAGSVVPILLYLFTDIKMSHTVYLTVCSQLPITLYYIAFAPVFSLENPSAGATDEWKTMHIKFPVMLVILLELFIFAQVYYGWEESFLQIVDFGRFSLLVAVIAALLIALCWVRTPKRMRKQDALAVMLLGLVAVSFALAYGVNLAISKPVEHYPAVVVARHGPAEENKDADRTLTVLLNDGTQKAMNVSKQIYELEQAGAEFVVCQKENLLGIRMARLHLPKGTDVSSLPNQ